MVSARLRRQAGNRNQQRQPREALGPYKDEIRIFHSDNETLEDMDFQTPERSSQGTMTHLGHFDPVFHVGSFSSGVQVKTPRHVIMTAFLI